MPNTSFEAMDDSAMTSQSAGESEVQEVRRQLSRPFSIKLEVDMMQLLLTVASLLSRTWQLGLPRAVV